MIKKDKDINVDEEIKRLSRKTNLNILRSEKAFNNRLKNLDVEMEKSVKTQFREFNEQKELLNKYLSIDFSSSTIERYRKKLKKI